MYLHMYNSAGPQTMIVVSTVMRAAFVYGGSLSSSVTTTRAVRRSRRLMPLYAAPNNYLSSIIQPEMLSSTTALSTTQLASSISTILVTASLLRILNLKAQSNRILSSATRMTVQLVVMGIFILSPLFKFVSNSSWKMAAWLTFVAALASREAVSRSKYTYKGQMLDCFVAIFGGVGLTLAHLVTCVLHPPFSTTRMMLNAETIIPIAGMLFGSALSATSLGMSILLSNFLENGRERVELRLSRGASVWESSLPAVREAVEAALMPTVNAMAAAGIIFMPGMMTGQILGGQSPATAAAYQLMIYFGIASSRTLTAIFLSLLITARLFDLQRQAFIPWRWIPGLTMTSKSGENRGIGNRFADPRPQSQFRVEDADEVEQHSLPLLQVQKLTVESTNLYVPLLEIHVGDRIGLQGKSGVGKSQLLRAIARLDPLSSESYHKTVDTDGTMTFLGESCYDITPAAWRSEIIWVCQDRPTISGTPRDFYNEVKCYRSQRQLKQNEHNTQQSSRMPMDIAKEWDLPLKTWDQPWNDLSGGEAQRLSLAIALSLRPKLLLLDEPTSSCDNDTTIMIEKTLIEMNVTLLLVSHSDEQLRRLCHKTVGLR